MIPENSTTNKYTGFLFNEIANEYIDYIKYIEKNVGAKVNYNILNPSSLSFNDINGLQAVAKIISNFIGMKDYIFIISTTTQKYGTAGHIELNSNKEVYIEISRELLTQNKSSLLATLAHEITHKYLYINNIDISSHSVIKNEILTDITSIYLGLGKLIINGCLSENSSEKVINNKIVTEKNKLSVGYLGIDHYTFIYKFICSMRKIPQQIYKAELSNNALINLSTISNNLSLSVFFNDGFHDFTIKDKLFAKMKESVKHRQADLAILDSEFTFLLNSYILQVEEKLKEEHKKIATKILEIDNIYNTTEYNPSLNYINTINLQRSIEEFKTEAKNPLFDNYSKIIKEILKILNSNITNNNSDNKFSVIKCRNDNTEIKIFDLKDESVITCPTCNYKFIVKKYNPSKKRKANLFMKFINPKKSEDYF